MPLRRLFAGLALVLAACGTTPATPPPTAAESEPSPSASANGSLGPVTPTIEPAPGSSSVVYAPNPGAIVVAIDAGHGGCLDWGVPDPSARGVDRAEKTLTLGIATRLAALLKADGIGVVMIREKDEALAGDNHPAFGCDGPAWRDVNGDGLAGFGDDDLPEGTRTRDELQARLDLANLAAADVLLSIHINSPTGNGRPVEIAFTETFYTDETPWGMTETARLATSVQAGVVAELGEIATYDRGDRSIAAHNFYMVAPPLFEVTDERPDPWRQPTRGGLMPVVLSEVGSISLRAEHDLLADAAGQDAVARGLFDGLAAFFERRTLAARIGLAAAPVGEAPAAIAGDGPPFWSPAVRTGDLLLRISNTGTGAWREPLRLVAGWEASDQPYLASAPELTPLAVEVPALEPGESATVFASLPPAPDGRGVAWISLRQGGGATLADLGSPALQLSRESP